jgi:transposase
MPAKKYVVALKMEEREWLQRLLRGGECKVRQAKRAQILLLANEGRGQEDIAGALQTSRGTVQRVCQRYCEGGLANALEERPRPGGVVKLTPKVEAYVVALACSAAPEGRECWTMQLLADQAVSLGLVDQLSDETVRLALKKRGLSLGAKSNGASRR